MAVGLLVGTGAVAQADPYDCSTWNSGNKGRFGNGRCTNGTGEYRLHGRCAIPLAPDPYAQSPWVRVGQIAQIDCRDLGVDYRAHSLTIEVR